MISWQVSWCRFFPPFETLSSAKYHSSYLCDSRPSCLDMHGYFWTKQNTEQLCGGKKHIGYFIITYVAVGGLLPRFMPVWTWKHIGLVYLSQTHIRHWKNNAFHRYECYTNANETRAYYGMHFYGHAETVLARLCCLGSTTLTLAPVLPLKPIYPLGHPENQLFLL